MNALSLGIAFYQRFKITQGLTVFSPLIQNGNDSFVIKSTPDSMIVDHAKKFHNQQY